MAVGIAGLLIVSITVIVRTWRSPAFDVLSQIGNGMSMSVGDAGGSALAGVTALSRVKILSIAPIGVDERLRHEGFLVLVYSRDRHEANPAGCQMAISQEIGGTPFGYFLDGRHPVVPKGETVELIGVYRLVGGNPDDQPRLDGWRVTYRLEPWSPTMTLDLPGAAVYALVDPDATTGCDVSNLRAPL